MDAAGGSSKTSPVEVRAGALVYPDAEAVARAVAMRWVELAQSYIEKDRRFSVALAGGHTPRLLYRLLAGDEFRNRIDWSKTHIFWGDERSVPPDDPDSNYGMARRELLSRVPLPLENIHRMEAEQPDAERAARTYEEILRQHLPLDARGFPRFPLILLGMGHDGHTASLFPPAVNLERTTRCVEMPYVEQVGGRRMTLTLPVLNAAHHLFFLITGAEKAEMVRRVVEGLDPSLPAQHVRPRDGERVYFLDAAAASALARR